MDAGHADFGRPVHAFPGLYSRFQDPDGYTLAPSAVKIRQLPGGLPELKMTIFGSLTSESYGILEAGFDVLYQLDDGLVAAREERTSADVRALGWSDASLWLTATSIGAEWAHAGEALAAGMGGGHVVHKLTEIDAEFLANLLTGPPSSLGALDAQVVAAVLGIAPRFDRIASFDPAALVADVSSRAVSGGALAVAAIPGMIRDLPAWMRLDRPVAGSDVDQLATAMADRVCARFARWDPLLAGPPRGGFRLVDPTSVSPGVVSWNLGEPFIVRRPVSLALDRAAFVSMIEGLHDRSPLVSKVIAPTFDFGVRRLHVYSRLARPRMGSLALGATLHAPASPPSRPFEVIRSADLSDVDEAELTIETGAPDGNPLLVSGYAVIAAPDGAHRVDGPERPAPDDWVTLGPDDFPVDIAVVEATDAVLAIGTVRGRMERPPFDPVDIVLTSSNPRAAIVAPRPPSGGPPSLIALALEAADGSQSISLAPVPLADMHIDLPAFRTFGPQSVTVTATAFQPQAPLLLVELRPEDGETVSLVRLTPDEPTKTWSYFAESPFRAGYRYRLRPEPGAGEAAWSPVRSADQPVSVSGAHRSAPTVPEELGA